MAIDWLTGNFYFVDDVDDRIFVCDKDGQTCVTLLDQELYNPKGIALDPTMGSVSSLTLSLCAVLKATVQRCCCKHFMQTHSPMKARGVRLLSSVVVTQL